MTSSGVAKLIATAAFRYGSKSCCARAVSCYVLTAGIKLPGGCWNMKCARAFKLFSRITNNDYGASAIKVPNQRRAADEIARCESAGRRFRTFLPSPVNGEVRPEAVVQSRYSQFSPPIG